MKFSIYRFDPEADDAKPRMQDYDVALEPTDLMLLDAILRIRRQDPSLSLRKSCREGVCGSDAMNINGRNGLACITRLRSFEGTRRLAPTARFSGDSLRSAWSTSNWSAGRGSCQTPCRWHAQTSVPWA